MLGKIIHYATSLRRRTLVVAMALASLGVLSVASTALAVPTGEYEAFAGCPLGSAGLHGCIVARTESGKFIIGKKTVPIGHTITLQGGFEAKNPCNYPFQGAGECRAPFVGAAEGYETLSKTAQTVPGGLFGLYPPESWPKEAKERFEEMVNKGLTGVTATTELAAPASSIGLSQASLVEPVLSEAFGIPALQLPVKVKLNNALLGEKCYIGSEAEPIIINLTTGNTNPAEPTKSIKGNIGEITSRAEGGILVIKDNSLVNNSFTAPGATGCGGSLSSLVDPLVNAEIGLPSGAGTNTAILNGTLEQTSAEAAEEHE